MSRITLYGPARTPFTEKVRRALLLKSVSFELREPQSPEDYRRWSPKTGLLPVLDLNGQQIADSTDILLKLDEVFPEPPLLSDDPRVASQQRALEDWADENLLYHYNRYLNLQRTQTHAPRKGLARFAALRRLMAWMAAGGTWERPETAILRSLSDRLDDLVQFLGTRPFFYADQPSMADLGVYSMLATMQHELIPGSAALMAKRPILIEFMRRVEELTSD